MELELQTFGGYNMWLGNRTEVLMFENFNVSLNESFLQPQHNIYEMTVCYFTKESNTKINFHSQKYILKIL